MMEILLIMMVVHLHAQFNHVISAVYVMVGTHRGQIYIIVVRLFVEMDMQEVLNNVMMEI